MKEKIIDGRWVNSSIQAGLLVLEDDRVKSIQPNSGIGLGVGDMLYKKDKQYVWIRKRGRPGKGGKILAPLTVTKMLVTSLQRSAKKQSISVAELRRRIYDAWLKGGL